MGRSFKQVLLQKLAKRSTLKYRFERSGKLWIATITGPFHHRFYGTCGMGMSYKTALANLRRTLQSEGWLGSVVFSDEDEADGDKVIRTRPTAFRTLRGSELVIGD